uniref:Ribonuclease P/MRP protein subunit POP5 n=1 Tax=Lutzomyia longipalpis TaxID=7200 RepID=A0A1B0F006_LUTLO
MVRVKYRYIVVRVTTANGKNFRPSVGDLTESLKGICLKSYGDVGMASVQSLKIKYIDEISPIFIMRLRHGSHRFMTSSLPLLKQIERNLLKLDCLFTTSTIKRCYMFLVENSEKILLPQSGKSLPKGP